MNPEYFRNRELSWISFNERVLSEAKDRNILLLERAKFLGITASNLDEFIMVRVASLKDQVHANYSKTDISGMTAKKQLEAINERLHPFIEEQYNTYNRSLVPSLKKQGINLINAHEKLTKEQEKIVDQYFMESVYPVLTPMAVDSSRPFPLIQNKSLNIAALVQKKKGKPKEREVEFVTVQVPKVLPRIFRFPGEECNLILLEEIIERNMEKLFLNYDILCAHPYRVMRNADLDIDEEDAVDLLETIEKQIKKRAWGEVIKLEVEEQMDKRLLKILKKEFKIKEEDIFKINGPLDLTFLSKLFGLEGFDHLRLKQHVPAPIPRLMNDKDIFTNIREGDIFLHHPYQTFDPVVDFVKAASKDPEVLAIKQTLYRVSGNSPIIAALAKAAENGKQVTVLVELKARFDEENNIHWARKLERAGCHVIYGLLGLKTHCKITLVVRMEEDGIRRYVHLGTGNYNDSTAKLYTDMGLLTCNEKIGEDATAVFNMISGYSEPLGWNKLAVAPLWLKNKFLELIGREKENALEGKPAWIVAKMNSLSDATIIKALYEASKAGVRIELIVRGICCLKTGIPEISENITVRSIVGNYLEHSRIYCFCNQENPEVFLASADWMPRNLDKRIEIMFPVEDKKIRGEVLSIIKVMLADNVKAHFLQPDGTYKKIDKRGKTLVCSQEYFEQKADEESKLKEQKLPNTRTFIPLTKEMIKELE